MSVGYKYKGVGVTIGGHDMEEELILLEFHDFDLKLRMNWLTFYQAKVDCFEKL